jgi:hypothetical protein
VTDQVRCSMSRRGVKPTPFKVIELARLSSPQDAQKLSVLRHRADVQPS